MSAVAQAVVIPIDLFAFGSRTAPRAPRIGIDLVVDTGGMVGPELPPFPAGASAFGDPQQAPLKGHYHRLPKGTTLPIGLAVVADGIDVHVNSPLPQTHHTIYPANQVQPEQFVDLFLALPWQYAGRKP